MKHAETNRTRAASFGDYFVMDISGAPEHEFVLLQFDGPHAIFMTWTEDDGCKFHVWPAREVETLGGLRRATQIKNQDVIAELLLMFEPAY